MDVGVIVFLAVFILIFTSALRYPEGFESGLLDGVRYWWGQHDVRRGGQPWFFYVVIYVAYEWLIAALARVGARRRVPPSVDVGAWFAVTMFVQLALYSWAGEKFAWLALHPLLPTILLGGIGAEAVWRRVGSSPQWRAPLAAAAAVAVVVTGFVASPAGHHRWGRCPRAARHGADVRRRAADRRPPDRRRPRR